MYKTAYYYALKNNMNINVYCCCYKNKINKINQYNQINLMLGSINYSVDIKSQLFKENFIFDDTGYNISHLNKYFGQLTGLYWVWKNTYQNIVGINTYRLFWNDYFLHNDFEYHTLYIPEAIDLKDCIRSNEKFDKINVFDQYIYSHGHMYLDFLIKLSEKKQIPITTHMIYNLKNDYYLHPFNMFIGEKTVFDQVCSVLFDNILFPFYDLYKNTFNEYEKRFEQVRILDFLAERILHLIYKNLSHFIPNIKTQSIPIIQFSH